MEGRSDQNFEAVRQLIDSAGESKMTSAVKEKFEKQPPREQSVALKTAWYSTAVPSLAEQGEFDKIQYITGLLETVCESLEKHASRTRASSGN